MFEIGQRIVSLWDADTWRSSADSRALADGGEAALPRKGRVYIVSGARWSLFGFQAIQLAGLPQGIAYNANRFRPVEEGELEKLKDIAAAPLQVEIAGGG